MGLSSRGSTAGSRKYNQSSYFWIPRPSRGMTQLVTIRSPGSNGFGPNRNTHAGRLGGIPAGGAERQRADWNF